MRLQQTVWKPLTGWTPAKPELAEASLVLHFGACRTLACGARHGRLGSMFPAAHIMGCSTGGQVDNDDVGDAAIVAAAVSPHAKSGRCELRNQAMTTTSFAEV